jgi:predicted transcriptional regulator/DNA-binding CsgD family transcriptional regulator
VLALAGLSDAAEQIYLFVIHRGKTLLSDVTARFDLDDASATTQLESLRHIGLISRERSDAGFYVPVDPRYSLTSMVEQLSEGVGRIRQLIPTLADQFDRGVTSAEENAETRILSDRDAVASWYVRLQHQATRELLVFDRPPYVSSSLEPLEAVVLGRGVSWRAVYTGDSFSREDSWEEAERLAEHGEQARILSELPVKLAIADRTTALVSLSVEEGRSDAIVTESVPLVAALCDLFEFYWARALPLPEARERMRDAGPAAAPALAATPATGATPTSSATAATTATPSTATTSAPTATTATVPSRRITREEQAILALIGAGLKDEVIARRLGMSTRSLRRRSHELMVELGADNRFQAGVEAARRGWV